MTAYTKPHLTFTDRVGLLKSRGLIIYDEAEAEHLLSVIGYYRLSGYWYSYRRQVGGLLRDDRFVEGTTFRQVVRLYDADRRLKLQFLDALERIEIALRVMIGFTLGRRGAYAHLDAANLDGRFTSSNGGQPSTYDRWLRKVLAAQARSSEDFVQHFQRKYDGVPLPGLFDAVCRGVLLSRLGQEAQWIREIRERTSVEFPACGRRLRELGFPGGWAAEHPWTA